MLSAEDMMGNTFDCPFTGSLQRVMSLPLWPAVDLGWTKEFFLRYPFIELDYTKFPW